MWRVHLDHAQKMAIRGMEVVTSADADIAAGRRPYAPVSDSHLELIDENAPRIGVRLRRDVIAMYLGRAGGIAYNPYMRVINVGVPFVMVGQVEDLATALVHEAAHARQIAMGVPKRPNSKLERRMEVQAVAEAVAFAERLPSGAWTKPKLADLDEQWWTWERRLQRVHPGGPGCRATTVANSRAGSRPSPARLNPMTGQVLRSPSPWRRISESLGPPGASKRGSA